MALPRGDEYNQAIQNPRINFSDVSLQACRVETTPLGLPKPYSGGFTTTYRLSNGQASWAVRCFTRDISDLQRRYQSIGTFQSTNNCDFLVEAKFVQNGIKVNGQFHPIIKMKWLDGEPLSNYLAKNYNQKSKIESIIKEFVQLIKKLEDYGIAHGDLQHGNIIVKNEKLYLIDYDGMYFPDLSGLKVNELGHPNFQHPKRTANEYNKTIDRFSAIVILTALKALIVAPSLWNKYDNGDNILFRGQDFSDPSNSKLLQELKNYSELSKLACNLHAISTWDFNKVPNYEEFLNNAYILAGNTTTSGPVRSAYVIIDGTQKGRLLEYLGQKVEVVGKISAYKPGTTLTGNPYVFLNFGLYPNQTFTIVVWSESLAQLKLNNIDPNNLVGKFVSVTGVLSAYYGNPQIAIDYANQIQILRGLSEVSEKLNPRVINHPPTNTARATTTKGSNQDEASVFNELYKNRRVSTPTVSTSSSSASSLPPTPKTIISPPSSRASYTSIPPPSSSSTYSGTNKTPTSSKKSNNNGCALPISLAVIAGILGLVIASDPTGLIVGAIIGGILGIIINGNT